MNVTLSEAIEYLKLKIEIVEKVLLNCLNPNAFYILQRSENVFADLFSGTLSSQIAELRTILMEAQDL